MNTTLHVTIPDGLKEEAQQAVKNGLFPSLSHLVRAAIRQVLPKKMSKQRLTVNGFTPEFEAEVLASSRSPVGDDIVLETDEDIDRHYDALMKEIEKERHAHQTRR